MLTRIGSILVKLKVILSDVMFSADLDGHVVEVYSAICTGVHTVSPIVSVDCAICSVLILLFIEEKLESRVPLVSGEAVRQITVIQQSTAHLLG